MTKRISKMVALLDQASSVYSLASAKARDLEDYARIGIGGHKMAEAAQSARVVANHVGSLLCEIERAAKGSK